MNGDEYHSLHIFANKIEENPIDPSDPNVIYYGPGVHYVSRIVVHSGQTLYIAPGAVLYGEMFQREPGGAYSPVISLIGDDIKVKGAASWMVPSVTYIQQTFYMSTEAIFPSKE